MAPKAHSLPRFAAALLLLAAAMVVQLETAAATSSEDLCVTFDQTCSQDVECLACKEVVGTNLDAFEQCQLNYEWSDDICVNQSAQPCCQNEASSNDCLANVAYVDFYECRLSFDVPGGECNILNCDAVAGASTESDTDTDATTDADATTTDTDTDAVVDDDDAKAVVEDDDVEAVVEDDDVDAEAEDDDVGTEASATENSAGRLAPSFLMTTTNNKAGFMVATGLSAVVVVAAAFV